MSYDGKYFILNSPSKIFEIEKSKNPILSLENLQRKQVFFNGSITWNQNNLISGGVNNDLCLFSFDGLIKKENFDDDINQNDNLL
jgi:hypothetical protein